MVGDYLPLHVPTVEVETAHMSVNGFEWGLRLEHLGAGFERFGFGRLLPAAMLMTLLEENCRKAACQDDSYKCERPIADTRLFHDDSAAQPLMISPPLGCMP